MQQEADTSTRPKKPADSNFTGKFIAVFMEGFSEVLCLLI
jgi:hypothetical protein